MEIDNHIQDTLNKFNKHKEKTKINHFLITFLNNYIQENYKTLEKPVKKLFIFNRKFYEDIIAELPVFIDDHTYYKEFAKLIKYNIIHPRSANYPLSFQLKSINPNHKSLSRADLKKLIEFQKSKNSFKDDIGLKEKLEDIYTYLRFFSIHPLGKRNIKVQLIF